MPPKIRELIVELERAGFEEIPGKGSHRNFRHPRLHGKITISGKSGDDAHRYQEREVRDWLRKAHDAKRP
jgi:predicted RNA binding protein YcfA (HicA-like mRNA interferase family)